jgi:hypothetical protein
MRFHVQATWVAMTELFPATSRETRASAYR